jgi:hypothetical protein
LLLLTPEKHPKSNTSILPGLHEWYLLPPSAVSWDREGTMWKILGKRIEKIKTLTSAPFRA